MMPINKSVVCVYEIKKLNLITANYNKRKGRGAVFELRIPHCLGISCADSFQNATNREIQFVEAT